ncbi:MAG TPA: hypothetical protein VGK47_09365 [Nitrososphaeraceae archaeon]
MSNELDEKFNCKELARKVAKNIIEFDEAAYLDSMYGAGFYEKNKDRLAKAQKAIKIYSYNRHGNERDSGEADER